MSLLTISTSLSDDIDIYVAPPPEATVGETLVVFTLDLRPNVMASTVCTGGECDALFTEVGMADQLDGSVSFFELIVAALKKVLYGIQSEKVKVALMVPHADTTGGGKQCVGFQGTPSAQQQPECSNGAYVLSAFRSTGDIVELNKFFEKMESLPLKDGGNWVHSYQLKELMFEMYRYVSGGKVFNGQNGLDDYGTGNVNDLNIDHEDDTIWVLDPAAEDVAGEIAELKWDTDAVEASTKTYKNALDTAEHCTEVFSVNVTFANSSQDHDSDAAIAADGPDGFGFDPANNSRGEEQMLEHLFGADLRDDLVGLQNIRSYFVTVPGGAANRADNWAQAGGTNTALVVEDDPDDLVRRLSGLFNEIQGVSTTFVSASVPANVFNRAETQDEVFLAVFEPNEGGFPFWEGNLKKLTKTDIDEIVLKDTNGDGIEEEVVEKRQILVDVLEAGDPDPTAAINPLDGRLRTEALTYWTKTGSNNEYLPPPTEEGDDLEFAEGTDGRKVARGGAGQVKPGYLDDADTPGNMNSLSDTVISGPRKLFTEPDSTIDGLPSDNFVDLDADSSFVTAIELLTDSRTYPGSSLSYGDYLFQTVMSDCAACTSYGSASATDQATAQLRVNNLIRFTRGFDVELDTPMSDTPPKRPWWQADPLHTRPLALNYGARPGFSEDRPDIRLLLAGNDGLVQLVRDGRKSDGSEDGVEAWAFLPREFVPLQKRLLEGTIGLYNPGAPVPDGDPPRTPLHPYAMDGAPTALVIDNNLDGTIDTSANDQVYAFFGQRRGGKRYYGLDISDPDDPKHLWTIGKDDPDGDFAELGQSWSLMRVGIMEIDEGGDLKRRAVLMFTGGYNGDDNGDGIGDLGKDSRVDNANSNTEIVGTDDGEGNAFFIVNALTGELIWKAVGTTDLVSSFDESTLTYRHPDLVDSIPSAPAILDADGDGVSERAYFPDTGGNVWRLNAGDPDRSNWSLTKLFSGGRHFQADNANDRRFFHPPDLVLAEDETGDFDAVILTSGDRAHPLGEDVENWIYMLKDRVADPAVAQTLPLTHTDLADLTDNCLQDQADQLGDLDFTSCSDASAETNLVNGWKVRLNQCEAVNTGPDNNCGEKGLSSPVTVEGIVLLTSYLPVLGSIVSDVPTTCGTAEGSGLLYGLDLQTASGVVDLDPSNNASGVETADRFVKLKSPGIPSDVVVIDSENILPPDLLIRKIPGRKSADTFWYSRRFN